MRILVLLFGLLPSLSVLAEWRLEPEQSRVSWVSLKRGDIAEVQRFTEISGLVDDQGAVRLVLPFTALDSGQALRDERMGELLFEVERFPEALLSARVDLATWEQLAVGEARVENLEFRLDLHGQQRSLKAEVLVSRLGEESMQVSTLEPVLIKAVDFDLLEGLERLKAIAKLPSISPEVPVFAVLNFRRRP